MNGVINLKKFKMIFEKNSLLVFVLLDTVEGLCYTELVRNYDNDDDFDCIYKITTREKDWVNLTADGRIPWEYESSCTLDSNKEIERCQNHCTR